MEISIENNDQQLDLSPLEKIVLSFALCLVAFMFVLDYTIANVAVPYIAGGLGVSSSEGTYVITFFSVGNAIFLPMTSYLVKMYGDAKVILWATVLFTFFSFTCAASPNLMFLVVSRFLQGAAAGPLIPLSQAILTKLYRSQVDKIATIFSMIIMIAPVIGPVVGGYICFNYLWRWIFYINIPIGAIGAFLIAINMKGLKDNTEKKEGFDWVSFLLLLVGMSALQLFLDKGQQWDWWNSYRVRFLSISSFLCISYILLWSFIYKKPLFNFSLFKILRFSLSCFIIFFAYSLYFAAVVIFPLWLEDVQGYTSYLAGLAVAPMGIGALIGASIISRLIKYLQPLILISLGFFFMALASFYAASFVPAISFFHVGMSRVLFGFGLSFWMVPTMSMVAKSLPNKDLASGLGLFHFLRSLSGGIGTAIYVTMYTRRGYQQHFNLASNFNQYKQSSRNYFADIELYFKDHETAKEYLNTVVDSQAATFSFCEVNNLMAYVMLFLMLVTILAIRKKSTSSN